jgi:hypothetical protein
MKTLVFLILCAIGGALFALLYWQPSFTQAMFATAAALFLSILCLWAQRAWAPYPVAFAGGSDAPVVLFLSDPFYTGAGLIVCLAAGGLVALLLDPKPATWA